MLKLENVSFKVEVDGENLEIIDNITGPNGGGKSTLARLIMGIEKPTSGKIYYNDVDITDLSVTERAKLGIGYAFQ